MKRIVIVMLICAGCSRQGVVPAGQEILTPASYPDVQLTEITTASGHKVLIAVTTHGDISMLELREEK